MLCVYCSKELNWQDGQPNCECGGLYFSAPQGSAEIKIPCPQCNRNILLERDLYGRKIACSCDTYLAVLECPNQNTVKATTPVNLNLLSDEDEPSTSEDKAPPSRPKKESKFNSQKTAVKKNLSAKRKTSSPRRQKQKPKAPLFIGLILLGLGLAGFYLMKNSDQFQVAQVSQEKEPVITVEEIKETLPKEIPLPKKEMKVYQAENLTLESIKQVINNFNKIQSTIPEQKVKIDLDQFKSIRKEDAPQYKKALKQVKIEKYQSHIKPFFEEFCIKCHGPEKQKGDMRLDNLSYTLKTPADVQHWQDILDSLNGAQMPPKKETQPDLASMSSTIRTLSQSLNTARINFASQTGVAALRRLNKREYKNTLEELLRITPRMEFIPEDNLYNNFDTVGESLTISPFQVTQYFKAAEDAIQRSLAKKTSSILTPGYHIYELEDLAQSRINRDLKRAKKEIKQMDTFKKTLEELGREGVMKKYKFADAKEIDRKLSRFKRYHENPAIMKYNNLPETKTGILVMPYTGPLSARLNTHSFSFTKNISPGRYIVRVHSALVNPEVKSVHLNIMQASDGTSNLISSFPVFKKFGEAQINELEVSFGLSRNDNKLILTSSPDLASPFEDTPTKMSDTKNLDGKDNIWIDRIEFIGPLPDEIHQLGLPKTDITDSTLASSEAENILRVFAKKAFRGSAVEDAYIKRLMKVFNQEFEHKKSLHQAIVRPLSTILSSGRFLYMLEKSSATRSWVSEDELATRLSYFLWSSMPDDKLMSLASKKILSKKSILQTQIDRMIDSPKFNGFLEGFVSQWFELDHLQQIDINKKLYKTYNRSVKQSSIKESQFFVRELFQKNLSLNNIIKSDFTVIDDSMALFYGFEPQGNNDFRVVKLPEDNLRAGILGHSSILTLTSNGERTSPVERGAYVLKKFLNFPKMNPPPNVPALDVDTGKQNKTVRASIAQHSASPQCSSCHDLIDPLGFAMENLDAIGKWRTQELIPKGRNKFKSIEIDATGRVLDSERMAG